MSCSFALSKCPYTIFSAKVKGWPNLLFAVFVFNMPTFTSHYHRQTATNIPITNNLQIVLNSLVVDILVGFES